MTADELFSILLHIATSMEDTSDNSEGFLQIGGNLRIQYQPNWEHSTAYWSQEKPAKWELAPL